MFGHLRSKSQNRIQHTSNLLGEVLVGRWRSRAGQGQCGKECRKGDWPCAGSLTAHSEDFPVSLLRAACDAWDLGESSRCFWSPALVLGQLALFSWPSLLLEHCPKCPLQGRLEEGLDWQPGLSVQAICSLSYAREPSFVWTKAVMTAGSSIAKSCTFE